MRTMKPYSEYLPLVLMLKVVVFVFAVVLLMGCAERDGRGSGLVVSDSASSSGIVAQNESTVTTSVTESSSAVDPNTGNDNNDTGNTDRGDYWRTPSVVAV